MGVFQYGKEVNNLTLIWWVYILAKNVRKIDRGDAISWKKKKKGKSLQKK